MPFQIIRNDITRVKADVIVNTDSMTALKAGTMGSCTGWYPATI